ncbi:hypothetical protein [uncultured Xanthomonas sp.]|uniref:hypothetical protein n=1 Tax=uncultured Xanthomonas sp. TaxID=152831 RepID=UPI0025D698BB|nr:hypothetical protein [uncultured Xanthomonas sp.]
MTSVDKSLAHSVGTPLENAVSAPLLPATLAHATCPGAMQTQSASTTAGSVEKIAQAGVADNLASLPAVLRAFKDNMPTRA